ncbi:MAG: hypothetical protein AAFO07_17390 [Bacteroidota bacterium]
MKNKLIYWSIFSIAILLILVLALTVLFQQHPEDTHNDKQLRACLEPDEKQKGVHYFSVTDTSDFPPLAKNNVEWITMVSWAFQNDFDSPKVSHGANSEHRIQHDSNWVERIQLARNRGFKVFFKPHLWIHNPSEGKWRHDVFPNNGEDWQQWQASYRSFILRYAKVAEAAQAEMYCIGVEFSRLTLEKPAFWECLIQDVRSVYSGKITYAANWFEEYEKITFWNQLDYIGVQAYFPLVKNGNPSVEEISKGWDPYLHTMESIHKKYNQKIIFTEMGYRSTTTSAIKPWEWIENDTLCAVLYSAETQANCYEAFFKTVWDQDWFAGVHIWQLKSNYELNEKNKMDFMPQGKPAEAVIARGFE